MYDSVPICIRGGRVQRAARFYLMIPTKTNSEERAIKIQEITEFGSDLRWDGGLHLITIYRVYCGLQGTRSIG